MFGLGSTGAEPFGPHGCVYTCKCLYMCTHLCLCSMTVSYDGLTSVHGKELNALDQDQVLV
jgi:hypothetical protein